MVPAFKSLTRPRHSWGIITSFTIWLVLVVLIGLRYQVGGDWSIYLEILDLHSVPWDEIKGRIEPLFGLLNYFSSRLGLGVYGINVICASIFSFGLVYFCNMAKRPWLALTMAIPYTVIVIGMGYMKQSVAVGLLLIGYVSLAKGKVRDFIILLFLASGFHNTSLIVAPLALPHISSKYLTNRFFKIGLAVGSIGLIGRLFLYDKIQFFIKGYIASGMQSGGAVIRIVLNLIPALLFLIYQNRLNIDKNVRKVWISISLFCIAFAINTKNIPNIAPHIPATKYITIAEVLFFIS